MSSSHRNMDTLISTMVLAFALCLPGQVSAQEIQVSGGLDEVNIYVAEEGDTLWDIADRFFSDPWYWPTLWSFNPHITNPNWIFPGDQVYLVPPLPKVERKEGYQVTESRYSAGPQVEKALGRRVGFISSDEFKGSGEIVNSREEKELLSETDEAYIKFTTARRVKDGDLFLVYRIEEEIEHPVTGDDFGHKIRYLGIAKVTSTASELTKSVLLFTFEEVERGDHVAPFAPVQRMVPPVTNATAVSGHIVTNFEGGDYIGEYHYVVVDRGSKDGVVPGNRFVVRRRGDGIRDVKKKQIGDFPLENFGEILVVEANDSDSLGIVTYVNREFEVGIACDMLAGY